MGNQDIDGSTNPEQLRRFMKCLLNDVRALECMINDGLVESGIRRIGAEQEVFLVDRLWRPAPAALQILEKVDHPDFTTELAQFNLEFNLDPLVFGGDCLSQLERALNDHLAKLQQAAQECGNNVVMTGILPTLRQSDLELENITPRPRYFALNNALRRLRGGAFEFRLTGTDELIIKHDTVLIESCNTSCQKHFHVGPEEFARQYNIAQVVVAPVLAAAANSPMLFGQRLWQETRIALFQQAVDTRSPGHHMQERSARVSFGNHWVKGSAIDIFRDDIARFRVVMAIEIDEDPFDAIRDGRAPKLRALQLHNGTVYRWNRPCYGVCEGKPHLRIENRTLPSGPTVVDEVANAAFWFGLMSGVAEAYDDVTEAIEFDAAKTNFLAASQLGLDTQLAWLDGTKLPAQKLICDKLLPIAQQGLQAGGIESADIDRFLGVIEQRVSTGRNGAQWLLSSHAGLKNEGTSGERSAALVAATFVRQQEGKPVHEWNPAHLEEAGGWQKNYQRVEQYMTTDIFTVHEDEVVDLVANLMDWRHIRHVPVEDDQNHLVGLVSYRSLLRMLAHDVPHGTDAPVSVKSIMQRNPITVGPETGTLDAIDIMRTNKVACLPVVKDELLVGIVTEHDFMTMAADLVESYLRES